MKTTLLLTVLASLATLPLLEHRLGSATPLAPPGVGVHEDTPPAEFVIAGTVTSVEGVPLAASVSVMGGGPTVTARANGTYILQVAEHLTAGGSIRIQAVAPGFAPEQREVTVSGTAVRVDFTLRATLAPEPEADEERSRLRIPTRTMQEAMKRGSVGATADMAASWAPASLASPPAPAPTPGRRMDPDFDTESYEYLPENPFRGVDRHPLSTFSIDVDRASYANVRRFIEQGVRPPLDAVRIEEMINYFTYDYPDVEGEHPFAVHTEVTAAPWNAEHRLVKIGIQGERIDLEDVPANNLVFLLDVSGSMQSPGKLPLLKQAFAMLVEELRPTDRVAIVVYAGSAGLVLESTPGDEKARILEAIERLEAGGSTAGGAGIRLAYDVARRNHIEGGNNRVILATDGDFNIGESSDGAMVRLIEEKREQGTFLTVLGFGTGNLKDSKMEQISNHGNGNYAYIDSELEARKVLVHELGGTLVTIAKDVKIQVEFNPAAVQAYRLIGYENRLLAAEDFNDDTKDAGELGAGHTVTALYEVVPAGASSPAGSVDPLRYQRPDDSSLGQDSDELLFVKLRYKRPDGDVSRLIEHPVRDRVRGASDDLRWAAAVAGFGMILRQSEHCGDFTVEDVLALARDARGDDEHGYRADFVRLVEASRVLELLEP